MEPKAPTSAKAYHKDPEVENLALPTPVRNPHWPPRPFSKGNPGRPKGSLNHSTRVRQQLLSCVGRDSLRLWKRQLRDPKKFVKAMDQVIALLGPSKPLVEIDNSQHTHFTVVLDGTTQPPVKP